MTERRSKLVLIAPDGCTRYLASDVQERKTALPQDQHQNATNTSSDALVPWAR